MQQLSIILTYGVSNALTNFIMPHGLAKNALHFWAPVLIPSAHLTEHQVIIKKRLSERKEYISANLIHISKRNTILLALHWEF